ncbi:uncharacterized protein LOC133706813 [Rosa rugosa]|uniref:uncharacterized protein LOC133706813 n=1 Tax=Rosa rugosa TaxID=74645 RepID=UPI002B4173D6|nr:uncharacterized protein LOC133706813 [Rosa rugosa]
MGGCDNNGNLHEEKFSEPMPWIGMYVAAASFACLIAMAADVILGFRCHKLWFPSKFFSINATTLTLLGVAIKLSVDLNTPMPNSHDQLAKLSSSVFICTAMSNSMPSLGAMENEEMFMNVIALGILVITLIVNICIQLATGAIFVFWKEHATIMFIMLVLLLMLIFSALTVPTTKSYLEKKYNKKYQLALKECANQISEAGKLREVLTKHWVLAHTSSPQFVMGRSVICTASGAFCLLSTVILAEAMLRTYVMTSSFRFCSGESDYKRTTTLILFTQAVAVGVGTIAPAFRWFMAINFKCPKRGNISLKMEFEIEKYWIQGLLGLKRQPLSFRIQNRHCRKLAHEARSMFLDICITMQKGIVLSSKAIRFISILFMSRIFLCCEIFQQCKIKMFERNTGPQSEQNRKPDFSSYVLFLEGEKALVEYMMRSNCDATGYWLQKGRKEEPKYLLKLLQRSTFSQRFKGVAEFDSDQVPSLDSEEPPNCWALPVVTLTSIALALSSIKTCSIEKLVDGVNQGLMYINAIDNHLDHKSDLANTRKAANIAWLRVDLYHTWLDVDLKKLSLGKSPREVLKELAETAKSIFEESKRKRRVKSGCVMDTSPSKWSVKELAANSMHRISQTLLLNQTCDDRLFEALVVVISDIVGACLTNTQNVMAMKCFNSKIEEREEAVRHAVHVVGMTERILEIVNKGIPPDLDTHQMGCIDEWRLSHKRKMIPSAFSSFPSDSECDGSPFLVQVISPQHKRGV